MKKQDVYLGCRVNPDLANEFLNLTTRRGVNKSFLFRQWITDFIIKTKENTTTKKAA